MDIIRLSDEAMASAGLPYDDINWYPIDGQPFGPASGFNVIVFNDANNIIDVEGPVAIGGSFYSPRGLSVGFVRDRDREIGYSPDLVRFLVGGNVAMSGPLVVTGHVVGGGGFRADKGSTYLIGKDGRTNGIEELKFLYQANGGSQYWTPTDKGDHYVVPSYDVPRYIPASRINANISKFFADARENIGYYKNCIEAIVPNGSVVNNNYEWILRGNDPVQNVFLIDVRPNGLINKGIRAEVPQGSTVIVRLRTGAHAHLQYGVYGEKSKVNDTLYVFEDASEIHMEKSSDIWGSILAPQAIFHAHPTGGHVSGNVALRDFAVNASSGFEFHYYPFVGGVICQATAPAPVFTNPMFPVPEIPQVLPELPQVLPEIPQTVPEIEEQPVQVCPDCPTCPMPMPCPIPAPCPTPAPCPIPEPCPTLEPCPICPAPITCPTPEPCPACPVPLPCPMPAPCPELKPCPECPRCPVSDKEYIAIPIPLPTECPKQKPCPVCEDCMIKPGIIMGCIWGCRCCNVFEWDVRLYERCNDMDTLLSCVQINNYDYFEFKVPYEGNYILKVTPSKNCCKPYRCKPIVTLKNIGVANFMVE